MIHQLKMPTLFISQSAVETKWPELLGALGQTVDNKTYTDTEIAEMDFETKSRLIRGDFATLVRYLDHHFNVFLKDVIFSKCKPIGKITDYFWRRVCNEGCYSCQLVCICKRCSRIWQSAS